MNEETERRIEEAAAEQRRAKQTREFLEGLTSNDQLLKPIYNPEAFIMRDKFVGAARRGDLPRKGCTHPLVYLQQYIDDDPAVKRDGKPVNLFVCGVCETPLWLVDPWGDVVSDS